ncbi:laminin subunit beta-4-like [Leptonychotes weddellii]|uniref:Laminin subunit beta-4-like n=1 Tax=Leptonychotes weddellii TaxID=9713 RepID=A0A7F8RX09_LEPWE|nr:laminin subunit beta-4-like [Leptonychotes weddellii]
MSAIYTDAAALAFVMGSPNFVIQRQARVSIAGVLQLEDTVKASSKIRSFESCTVLKHSKSTSANVRFSWERLVKRNCLARCIDGYYGNPPSGRSCRPCRCPDVPSSSQYFAHSCYQHPWSSDVICNCLQGYAGKQCGECSAGFYGNPRISGASCQPCACHKNTDVTDPESCSRLTGECLKCLHNTQGPHCQFCKPGYFGSAVNQTCRRCSCHPSGVNPAECPPGRGACLCDPDTGTCPCLPNVTGQACDRCADGYWNLVPGRGCQPCDCEPRTSHGSHCDQARCSELT